MDPKTLKNRLVQVKMNDELYKDIKEATKTVKNTTISETIREAIKIFLWLVKMKESGYKVIAEKGNDKYILPF